MRSTAFLAGALLLNLGILGWESKGVSALSVWPQPRSVRPLSPSDTSGNAPWILNLDLNNFRFHVTGHSGSVIDDAIKRTSDRIFGSRTFSRARDTQGDISDCYINVATMIDDPFLPNLEMDQSYNLSVSLSSINISAISALGALHGLESFSQLVFKNRSIEAVEINDSPRFIFRGFMIDTSRHYYTISTILKHLDAMAAAKLNVLHWHLVDDQSFPFVSMVYPNMSATGAYSPSHVYTRDDIRQVIAYAASLGIAVMPEFDTPGHMTAGYNAIPNLLTECYDTTTKKPLGTTGPINPTLNSTYDFASRFFGDVANAFPFHYLHIGGDEVPFTCWESNPEIQQWLAAHPEVESYSKLEQYYELKLLDIVVSQLGKDCLCWEEVFDNGVQLPNATIIDVWKGGWNDTLDKAMSSGFHAVLSAPFYLNYISYGEDWKNYYQVEPFNCGATHLENLLGLKACMWSEYVDSTNFIPRTWPRAAAVAERAWSPISVNDTASAGPRLDEFRCKLIQRGIPAEPVTFGTYCDVEYEQNMCN